MTFFKNLLCREKYSFLTDWQKFVRYWHLEAAEPREYEPDVFFGFSGKCTQLICKIRNLNIIFTRLWKLKHKNKTAQKRNLHLKTIRRKLHPLVPCTTFTVDGVIDVVTYNTYFHQK